MGFFNTTRTTADLQKLLNDSNELQSWWLSVRDEYTSFGFFASYQTRLLDKSIETLILKFGQEQAKQKQEALLFLYTQVLNWQHFHTIRRQHSDRIMQVSILRRWLEKHIFENDLVNNKYDLKQKFDINTDTDTLQHLQYHQYTVNKYLQDDPEPKKLDDDLYQKDLYQWWKKNSNLGWFKIRSRDTKELDKAIHWFTQSIIMKRLEGLQEILDATEVWLNARENVSQRVNAVKQLQKRVALEMSELLQQGTYNHEVDFFGDFRHDFH